MDDQELVDLIVDMWVKNGGDLEGFTWLIKAIYVRIHQSIKEAKNDRQE